MAVGEGERGARTVAFVVGEGLEPLVAGGEGHGAAEAVVADGAAIVGQHGDGERVGAGGVAVDDHGAEHLRRKLHVAGVVGGPAGAGEVGAGGTAHGFRGQFRQLGERGLALAAFLDVLGGARLVHGGDGGQVADRQVLLHRAVAVAQARGGDADHHREHQDGNRQHRGRGADARAAAWGL